MSNSLKNMALTLASWNQVLGYLKNMELLRQTTTSGTTRPSKNPSGQIQTPLGDLPIEVGTHNLVSRVLPGQGGNCHGASIRLGRELDRKIHFGWGDARLGMTAKTSRVFSLNRKNLNRLGYDFSRR